MSNIKEQLKAIKCTSQYKYLSHRLTSGALKDVRSVDWAPHFIFSSCNHVSVSIIQTSDLILNRITLNDIHVPHDNKHVGNLSCCCELFQCVYQVSYPYAAHAVGYLCVLCPEIDIVFFLYLQFLKIHEITKIINL